uniref:Uncharacterized protein n=1 Tax=Tanacetum cinerariifolium TaxID=118510 RepID=A0A699KXB1_TANCI|nr:hypothetical protein [Tanacetum cinerariifolium]
MLRACAYHADIAVLQGCFTLVDQLLLCRLLQGNIQLPPDSYLPVDLEDLSFGSLDDSGSFPALLLFDPRFDPAKGSSSSSSSSQRLLIVTVSPYVARMSLSDS